MTDIDGAIVARFSKLRHFVAQFGLRADPGAATSPASAAGPCHRGESPDLFHPSLLNFYEQSGAGFAEEVWTALREGDEKAQRPEREV